MREAGLSVQPCQAKTTSTAASARAWICRAVVHYQSFLKHFEALSISAQKLSIEPYKESRSPREKKFKQLVFGLCLLFFSNINVLTHLFEFSFNAPQLPPSHLFIIVLTLKENSLK